MLELVSEWLSGAAGLAFLVAAVLITLFLDVSDEAARTDVGGHALGWLRRRRTRRGSLVLRLALVVMLLGTVVATVVRILPAVG